MAKWTDYPTKTTPADTDDLMIYDATGKANKRVLFSGLWNWIVDKLTNAVISNLQTNNKTILGALNELNSNPFLRYSKTYGKSLTIENVRMATHGIILIESSIIPFYIGGSTAIGYRVYTGQLPENISISNTDEKTLVIETTTALMITCIYAHT